MKRCCQIFVCTVMIGWTMPAWAEIDQALLLGEWCLVQQSMLGHDFETPPPKVIRDNLKAKAGQRYRFVDEQTVEIQVIDEQKASFTYKISGKSKDRIRIKGWETFKVTSLTDSEMITKVLGTVIHRFARGKCELP